jgi:hypothetical protein
MRRFWVSMCRPWQVTVPPERGPALRTSAYIPAACVGCWSCDDSGPLCAGRGRWLSRRSAARAAALWHTRCGLRGMPVMRRFCRCFLTVAAPRRVGTSRTPRAAMCGQCTIPHQPNPHQSSNPPIQSPCNAPDNAITHRKLTPRKPRHGPLGAVPWRALQTLPPQMLPIEAARTQLIAAAVNSRRRSPAGWSPAWAGTWRPSELARRDACRTGVDQNTTAQRPRDERA